MSASIILWGFLATGLLTTLLSCSHLLKLTRIDLPYLLGTLFTTDRDRAKVIGFFVHFLNGWILAMLYAVFFEQFQMAAWWLGSVMGAAHAAFVLVVMIPSLPHWHPLMASEGTGPDPTKLLEPPGFLALNYGRQTPLSMLAAHMAYGTVLGAFYSLY